MFAEHSRLTSNKKSILYSTFLALLLTRLGTDGVDLSCAGHIIPNNR